MDQQLFHAINAQAVKAAGVVVLAPEQEPEHRYAIVSPNGSIEWREAEARPRKHVIRDFETLKALVRGEYPNSEIWYSRKGVQAFLDKTNRRDVVSLPFSVSPQMRQLLAWEQTGGAKLSQSQMILILRTVFCGCLGRAGDVIGIFRRVKFNQIRNEDSTVQHGRASIGKSIESELTGVSTIPERITFEVPIFSQFTANRLPRGVVTCAVEIDAANQTIQLIPEPLAIEEALGVAECQLEDELTELINSDDAVPSIPIYFGDPNGE